MLDPLPGLFTSGKLRVVPVDSSDETDGPLRGLVVMVVLTGGRIAEYVKSCLLCPSGLDRS